MSSYNEHTDEEWGDDVYDMIEYQEGDDKEYIQSKCYLGVPYFDPAYKINLLASSICANTFYKNTYADLMYYLFYNSISHINNPRMQIMQLHITNNVYEVVIKTFWLKLIQRTWKNVYANQKKWCKMQSSRGNIHQRQLQGQGARPPCQLKGMLSYLNVSR